MIRTWVIPLVAAAVGFAGALDCRRAEAEDWPGWRKDGSGVSLESDLPVEWSWDKNVRWKTPVIGSGAASPIVWKDQVFLANAYAGEEQNAYHGAIIVAITILCAMAVWTLLDGTLGDPRANDGSAWSGESRWRRVGRKLALAAVFLLVGYATIAASEWAVDRLKGVPSGERISNKLFDRTWLFCALTDAAQSQDVRTPLSALSLFREGSPNQGQMFVGAPRIPKACYYAGAAALLAVFAVNTVLKKRRSRQLQPSGAPQRAPETRKRLFGLRLDLLGLTVRLAIHGGESAATWASRAFGWLAAIVVACFLITLHSAVMADLPYQPRGETWYLSGGVLVFGLIAALLWSPDRLVWRIAVLAIGVLAVAYLLVAAPEDHVGKASTALNRAQFPSWAKTLVTVAPIALVAAFFGRWRGARAVVGSLAMLLAAGLYFFSANWLLPSNVFVREVLALNRLTGKVQWATQCYAHEASRELHPANTMASPTPVTDGEHVFAQFGEAGLFCLDMQGHLKWRYAESAQPSHWGAGSSPILWQDLVIVTFDTDETSFTVAVDKERGEERWRCDRKQQIVPSQKYDAYTTPIVVQRNGAEELVHHTTKLLAGYDPANGHERWAFSHPGEQPIATPVVCDDLIIVLGGTYARYLGAIRVGSSGATEAATEAWQTKSSLPDLCSPVVYDGLVYMVTTGGIASCLDARSGETRWKHRLGGAFWSSVTAGDGKVYFCDAAGVTTVVAAGPKYEELSVNKLGQDVQASFAVSGGGIFIRTREHLICVGPEK